MKNLSINTADLKYISEEVYNEIKSYVISNANVKSITNSKPVEGGADEETDNALRSRYYLRLSMPATSGNKAHYILWALECVGVGGATIYQSKM